MAGLVMVGGFKEGEKEKKKKIIVLGLTEQRNMLLCPAPQIRADPLRPANLAKKILMGSFLYPSKVCVADFLSRAWFRSMTGFALAKRNWTTCASV